MTMRIKRVVIVHGHDASPSMHWFSDLAKVLQMLRYAEEVLIPPMPHPHLPDIRSWKQKLSSIIGNTTEETAVIGHSFGAITTLRLADSLPPGRKLGAIILVSCPIKWVWGGVPARVLFREPDWNRVRESVRHLAVIHSDDDWVAPLRNATYMQGKLDCGYLVLHGHKHLCCPILPLEAKERIIFTLGLQ